jgi:hypothetical protein
LSCESCRKRFLLQNFMKDKPTIQHLDMEIQRNHPCYNLPICKKANLLDLSKFPRNPK